MKEYSIFDAAKIIEKDHTALREWLKLDDFPLDESQKATGRGTKTILYIDDLYRIKAFELLLSAGMKREMAARFIKILHPNDPKFPKNFDWNTFYLHYAKTYDGNLAILITKGRPKKMELQQKSKTGTIKQSWDFVLEVIINLKLVKKMVDEKIE